MAVDYANKYRARAGEKWALRNIKLRMSRKLLFVSGFFMCISWNLARHGSIDENLLPQELVRHLQTWTQRSPLESLATIIEQYAPPLCDPVFDSYDAFLQLLGDGKKRKALEELAPEAAYKDEVFLEARRVSSRFDDALIKLLFEFNRDVSHLARQYGVF